VRTINKVDRVRTKADDQKMPVWQHSCGCAMGWRGLWWFFGQSSSCRMCRNGLHGKRVALSHGRACASVCAFLRRAWCTLNRCPGHQCMQMIDWYCFYYSVKNSLVALLEDLFARILFFRFVKIVCLFVACWIKIRKNTLRLLLVGK